MPAAPSVCSGAHAHEPAEAAQPAALHAVAEQRDPAILSRRQHLGGNGDGAMGRNADRPPEPGPALWRHCLARARVPVRLRRRSPRRLPADGRPELDRTAAAHGRPPARAVRPLARRATGAAGDVETMVLAAKQRSLYELTDAISAKDKSRALSVLNAVLSTGEGDDAAIGHLYMLARTFRQMMVILEKNVRDTRTIWQALWQGFRVPPFAAEDIIRQARRYKSRRELSRALKLIARADMALRSNPPSKRLILEQLVLQLSEEPKVFVSEWQQDELPV